MFSRSHTHTHTHIYIYTRPVYLLLLRITLHFSTFCLSVSVSASVLAALSVWSQSVSVRRVGQSLSFYSCHAHSCYMHVFVAGRHGQTQCQTGNGSSGFCHWTEWTMDPSERCRLTVWSSVTDAASSDICTRDWQASDGIRWHSGRPYKQRRDFEWREHAHKRLRTYTDPHT